MCVHPRCARGVGCLARLPAPACGRRVRRALFASHPHEWGPCSTFRASTPPSGLRSKRKNSSSRTSPVGDRWSLDPARRQRLQRDLAQRIDAGCVRSLLPTAGSPRTSSANTIARSLQPAGRPGRPRTSCRCRPSSSALTGTRSIPAMAAGLPILLAPAQEQALWEGIIRDSEAGEALLAIPETAALAREAWQLAHAWRLHAALGDVPLNEDAKAFQQWAQRYETITRRERHTDGARLADVIASLLARTEIRKPKSLVHYGFDLVMPQQAALFEALAAAGCEVTGAGPEPRGGERLRLACADSADEIRRAAAWARARLEAQRRGAHRHRRARAGEASQGDPAHLQRGHGAGLRAAGQPAPGAPVQCFPRRAAVLVSARQRRVPRARAGGARDRFRAREPADPLPVSCWRGFRARAARAARRAAEEARRTGASRSTACSR